jgi:hypothetical protein
VIIIKVLSENFKWVTTNISISGVYFGKFIRFRIPFWIQRSKLSDESIKGFKNFYKRLDAGEFNAEFFSKEDE